MKNSSLSTLQLLYQLRFWFLLLPIMLSIKQSIASPEKGVEIAEETSRKGMMDL